MSDLTKTEKNGFRMITISVVSALVGIILGLGSVAFQTGVYKEKVLHMEKVLEKKVDILTFERFEIKISEERNATNELIKEMKDDISNRLDKIDIKIENMQ